MKITVITTPSYNEPSMDGRLETIIETKEGKSSMCFGEGEPEDMYLFRDLSDAYTIKDALILAYTAGKNGESLKIEELKRDE